MTLVVSGGLDDTLDVLEQAKTANTMEAATATLPTMVDVDIQMFFYSNKQDAVRFRWSGRNQLFETPVSPGQSIRTTPMW